MAKQLNLTSLENEQESYILTKDDEDYVISNSLQGLKQHMIWKLQGIGYTEEQIIAKIKEVDWDSKIDRDALLKRANSNKNYERWQIEQRAKEKQKEIDDALELKKVWTAKNVYGLMKWTSFNLFGKQLVLNQDNEKLIKALCFLISDDERYETELRYSFKKGLLIRGVSGLGKTFLVKCIEKNRLNPIRIESMIEVADEVKQNGEYFINQGECKMIYLDDVGTEEATINHYGTKINWFKNFIETVYLRNVDKGFGKLIISTNNSFAEMEDKYGFRVRSRVKDMFNIIDVTGKDMRG